MWAIVLSVDTCGALYLEVSVDIHSNYHAQGPSDEISFSDTCAFAFNYFCLANTSISQGADFHDKKNLAVECAVWKL